MFGFFRKHNILILGSNGMLGHDVYEFFTKKSQERDSIVGTVIGLDVQDGIDLVSPSALCTYMRDSIHYDYCINCVAYTNTQAAETTPEGRDMDYKLNALAPKHIATACLTYGTKLIHVSTDYVFSEKTAAVDSNGKFAKFDKFSEEFPCNVYGGNKLLGELYIKNVFRNEPEMYSILRTSWLYGEHNQKSFVHKFMNNVVKQAIAGKTAVDMTCNEVSVPTSTQCVVDCISHLIGSADYGVFHAVPSSESGVSRLEWAKFILETYPDSAVAGNIQINKISVDGVERDSYQPKFSAMESSFNFKDWTAYLTEFMSEFGEGILDSAKKVNNIEDNTERK